MTKKITKSLSVLLIGLFIAVGCSKDDDAALNKCFLTKTTYDGSTASSTFTYTDNKLTKITYSGGSKDENSTLTYDSKGNVAKVQDETSYTVYTYNESNQVTKDESYYKNVLEARTEYEYNSSGQLIKTQFYYISSGTATKSEYFTYEYSSTGSKNAFKRKSFSSSGTLTNYVEYEYDTKNTPYSALGLSIVFNDFPGENNATKEVKKSSTGAVNETSTYVYEYNDKGYPTKVTTTAVYAGSPTTYTDTTFYTYDCK